MKYFGRQHDFESSHEKIGILITNLGTPDAPKCPKLRQYLTQFLTDPRVIELPYLLRQFLVRGIIINIRSHKSAAAYRTVWTDKGSPLMFHTQDLATKVQHSLGDNFIVAFGMRYGKPSIDSAIKQLHQKGCRKLIIMPMYPQYSGSTSGSIMDAVGKSLKKIRWVPHMHFISDYFQHDLYIKALCQSIERHWQEHGKAEKLVFSFHGIPQRYVHNGDPYQIHCQQTVDSVCKQLRLKEEDYLLVYQSRVGKEPWLQPYCDETMKSLPNTGIKNIDVICPGFSADCLETIEEIDEENKEYFMEAGGESYRYIHCLNSNDDHTAMVDSLIRNASSAF